MLNALTRAAKLGTLLAVAIFATAAGAQAPSQAQRDAIKSQCRGDYMAHCSSVPPGGAESLQCLQKNMSSLSAGCASAVKAVEAPAAPKAETAPKADATPAAARTEPAPAATTTAKPATETAAPKAAPAGTSAKQPQQRADFRDPQRLPLRLSKSLRQRPDRRRAGPAMPGKEQGKTFGRLWTGGQRGKRRHCRAGNKRRNRGCTGGDRCAGGASRDRAAADAAA
jgi:hypothetical protein